MTHKTGEKTELVHEPVKGYRAAFYIVIGIAAVYLAWIFIDSWLGVGA